MRYSIVLVGSLLFASTMARACLNDRDTLAEEAQRFPDAVRVITGRFPRNPPLYYQMRIERETGEIATRPDNLALYDDVAVAWDRLGNDDKALAVMARKLARMKALKTPGDLMGIGDTPWYRYYANTGTFLAHRYLRHSGKFPLSDMAKGRDLIAESIRVNPHAHFGRERVQLAVMDYIVEAPDIPLGDYLSGRARSEVRRGEGRRASWEEWRKGLEGLIVLGGAWVSPDAFSALGTLFQMTSRREMAEFSNLRARELMDAGIKPLNPSTADKVGRSTSDGPAWSAAANFTRLRKDAEQWHVARAAYMMDRLQAGRHPDTDPNFWADWREPPAPKLLDKPLPLRKIPNTVIEWWQFGLYALAFGGIGIGLIRRWRRTGFNWGDLLLYGGTAFLVLILMASV